MAVDAVAHEQGLDVARVTFLEICKGNLRVGLAWLAGKEADDEECQGD